MPDKLAVGAVAVTLDVPALAYFDFFLPTGELMPFQNVQSAFAVAAAAGAAAVATVPPLTIDDYIDRLTLFLRGADGNVTVDQSCVVELYLCNSKPASVAEARNGQVVLPAITVPLVPILTATAVYSHMLSLTLPLATIVDARTLSPALVVTGPSGAALAGVAFLGVQRSDPEA